MHKKQTMKYIRKNFRCLIPALVFILICLMTSGVFAQEVSETNPETGYLAFVDDMAGLLTREETYDLLESIREISAYGNVGFVSVYSHPYSSEFDFANSYFHSRFGSDSGTIFIVDMQLRKLTVFSDGAIYRTVTKSYANTITDNVYTYASDGQYYVCAQKAFEQIQRLLEGKRIAQPMKYISNFLLALILALMINYFRARLNSGASSASDSEWLEKLAIAFDFRGVDIRKTSTSKRYNPPSKSSGGGSGGGGGGSSGGGGSHSF